jgi:hypothetical protein
VFGAQTSETSGFGLRTLLAGSSGAGSQSFCRVRRQPRAGLEGSPLAGRGAVACPVGPYHCISGGGEGGGVLILTRHP